jgi:hypothetical protein
MPTVDLRGLGVKLFSIQLHHTGSVGEARVLIARLRDAGYVPVARTSVVKITFMAHELITPAAVAAAA